MKKDTFDVFCPQCNVVVEVKAIAESTGEFHSEALNIEDQVDAMYDAEHYSICICHRCNQVFLIQETLRGVPAEFETVTDSVVLLINDNYFFLSTTIRIPGFQFLQPIDFIKNFLQNKFIYVF